MRIEAALGAIRALHDLPALVAALGGEPRFGELGPGAWLGDLARRMDVIAAAEIGVFGPLPALGMVTSRPPQAAERVARHCATQGAPALIIAISDEAVSIAIGGDPVSVLTLDPTAPDAAALTSLRRLNGLGTGSRTATALRIGEALAAHRVDRTFFTAFAQIRERMAEEGPDRATLEDRRALALLQLTRVLFLYFIQRKGWLDGQEDFLARAVEDHLTRRRPVARDLLRPLFHGTLDREPSARSAAVRRFGRIPFLNGGLFEPHLLERRWSFDHSDAIWRTAFDELFERFHFTLDERGDGRSIAPDMLGRVFEGLMAGDERRATGTFYTPARLVDKIVSAGAASLVAERIGVDQEEGRRLLADRTPTAGLVLARCRVLDLAVGSGAFLLGALHLLAGLERVRDPAPGHRRRIIRSQLFGVDISAEAVRLAELRLWLAAVADDPDGVGAAVEPLPNLDAALRQGDSLHDPRWLAEARRVPRRAARELAAAREAFAGESGSGKRRAWRRLRDSESASALEALEEAECLVARKIGEALEEGRALDLFGARRGIDRLLGQRLGRLREDRRRIRNAARRLRREGSLPWFDAPSAFGEVFASRGGFDLVVGNPPWVRAEQLPAATREGLADRYRWWRSGTGRGFAHRPDLAVAFLERGFDLCAPGGVVAMLIPAKVATSGYGTVMRGSLATEMTIDHLADLTDREAGAFAAVTYPLAIVARKRTPASDHRLALSLDGAEPVPQASLSGAPWVLRAPDTAGLLAALREGHPRLAERCSIHLGVKSGCNAAFLDPPEEIDAAFVRPAVRGRGISPFRVTGTVRVLFPHDTAGRPLRTVPPAVVRHLGRWRSELMSRADATRGPWWALHRTTPACAPHRVVWADLARRLEATTLPPRTIPLNSCYLALAPDAGAANALTAWLNAGPIRALARAGADPARGGFARFNARVVGGLPLSQAATANGTLATLAAQGAEGKEVQDVLDRTVADLLGLDARDRSALCALA
jgi:hypothetical protein